MSRLALRLDGVRPSASMAVSQAPGALITQGVDAIDLGLGEPTSRLGPYHRR
jgi:aspartate aminotransferase